MNSEKKTLETTIFILMIPLWLTMWALGIVYQTCVDGFSTGRESVG